VHRHSEAKREALRQAIENTEDEVQALGIQMNQIYDPNATSAVKVETGDRAPDFSKENSTRNILLSTFPGYHLPHVWLAKDTLSPRVSTLDLSGCGSFTLFTGVGGEECIRAGNAISSAGGVKINGHSVGFGCEYMDCYRDWFKVRGVDESGVVLVRPDHFVAWRCPTLVDEPETKLRSVLRGILGR
jgi:hypothetical protein